MKERPLLFSGPMVRAILEGRKTQTRRVVKDKDRIIRDHRNKPMWPLEVELLNDQPSVAADLCPYGKPGDRLWIRETWQGFRQTNIEYNEWEEMESPKDRHDDFYHPVYKADGKNFPEKWQPSIHMPREYSRISLEITGVRVERLQDISNEDAQAEGCFFTDYGRRCFHRGGPPVDVGDCPSSDETHPQREGWAWDKTISSDQCLYTAKSAFENLWETVNGQGSWGQNPWVWVIEFKRLLTA